MPLVVGVDESGTGAWAGPFHVGAVAVDPLPFNRAIGRYLRDSKKLNDAQRRKAAPLIREHAVAFAVVEVPVWEINLGLRTGWRIAISKALAEVRQQLGGQVFSLLIDGPEDDELIRLLSIANPPAHFEVEGDTRFPAVMAAAILAKTARNDAMVALSSEFPEYGWDQNAGYGVPYHRKACEQWGVTKHHRRIRQLKGCKEYRPTGEWFGKGEVDAEDHDHLEVREGT